MFNKTLWAELHVILLELNCLKLDFYITILNLTSYLEICLNLFS